MRIIPSTEWYSTLDLQVAEPLFVRQEGVAQQGRLSDRRTEIKVVWFRAAHGTVIPIGQRDRVA